MIKVKLPDNTIKKFPTGTTSLDVAFSISEGLARNVLAAEVNGEIWDAQRELKGDQNEITLKLLTWKDEKSKHVLWHSSAHLMAEAIQSFYPNVKFTIGPSIDNGFYYDIELGENETFSSENFEKIENKMLDLAREKNKYIRKSVTKKEALDFYKKKDNNYKIELINDLEDGSITFYTQGNFTDLCKGAHIPSSDKIKAIKLLNIAGAYWRGDEKRKQLTRIYGISFPKQKELTNYLELLEEAKKRDHRKLGAELGLFAFSDLVGKGLPMFLPAGNLVKQTLADFITGEKILSI